ncbi:MAG: hypothetical protein R6U61_04315 [Thermoplasmata archaeon]
MEDRYEKDEKTLLEERKKLTQRIQQASQMLEQLKGNLINVNAKLEYIQYRRKEEESVEEVTENNDAGSQETSQG